jgi:SPP1 family predicted phage head-tail adaptor
MNPGELNKKVTIERPVDTPDAQTGAPVRTWEDVATVWAKIEPLAGREFWQAQQSQSAVTHQVEIWYRRDVTCRNRLRFVDRLATRYLDIAGMIDPGEEHVSLILQCVEYQT